MEGVRGTMKKTGKIIAIIVVLALVVSGVFLFAG